MNHWAMILLADTAKNGQITPFTAFFFIILGMAVSRYSTIRKQKKEEKLKAAQMNKKKK